MPDKKPKVVIRADGNREIGFGHVFRCLALAQMLNKDFECWFYIQNPEPFLKAEIEKVVYGINELPNESNFGIEARQLTQHALNGDEIVVLDGYHFDLDYQKAIKANRNPLVFIDDLAEQHFVADVVINHAEGISKEDYSAEPYTHFCLGSKYVLLRPPFLEEARESSRFVKKVDSVFVSMGGGDKEELNVKALKATKGLSINHINVIGNLADKNKSIFESSEFPPVQFHNNLSAFEIIEIMSNSQMGICPASTMALETCSVGTGLIVCQTAQNQKGIFSGLINNEMALGIESFQINNNNNDLKHSLQKLINNPHSINDQIALQKQHIDGYSPDRIQKVFNNLSKEVIDGS